MLRVVRILIALSSIALISACGGGGGGGGTPSATTDNTTDDGTSAITYGSSQESITGQFVDAPVIGLNYKTSDTMTKEDDWSTAAMKFTSENGTFSCELGTNIQFSVGEIVMGETGCKEVITPVDLVDNGTTDSADAQAMTLFLMALDSDLSDSNITIPESVRQKSVHPLEYYSDVYDAINQLTSDYVTPVTIPTLYQAKLHLENSIANRDQANYNYFDGQWENCTGGPKPSWQGAWEGATQYDGVELQKEWHRETENGIDIFYYTITNPNDCAITADIVFGGGYVMEYPVNSPNVYGELPNDDGVYPNESLPREWTLEAGESFTVKLWKQDRRPFDKKLNQSGQYEYPDQDCRLYYTPNANINRVEMDPTCSGATTNSTCEYGNENLTGVTCYRGTRIVSESLQLESYSDFCLDSAGRLHGLAKQTLTDLDTVIGDQFDIELYEHGCPVGRYEYGEVLTMYGDQKGERIGFRWDVGLMGVSYSEVISSTCDSDAIASLELDTRHYYNLHEEGLSFDEPWYYNNQTWVYTDTVPFYSYPYGSDDMYEFFDSVEQVSAPPKADVGPPWEIGLDSSCVLPPK
jgi:hypothetical protein